jgi:hypothetical protein
VFKNPDLEDLSHRAHEYYGLSVHANVINVISESIPNLAVHLKALVEEQSEHAASGKEDKVAGKTA